MEGQVRRARVEINTTSEYMSEYASSDTMLGSDPTPGLCFAWLTKTALRWREARVMDRYDDP